MPCLFAEGVYECVNVLLKVWELGRLGGLLLHRFGLLPSFGEGHMRTCS